MPTFYCYSRCSTCKKAQKWLDDHQVAYDQQDLVAEPPAKELFVIVVNRAPRPGPALLL